MIFDIHLPFSLYLINANSKKYLKPCPLHLPPKHHTSCNYYLDCMLSFVIDKLNRIHIWKISCIWFASWYTSNMSKIIHMEIIELFLAWYIALWVLSKHPDNLYSTNYQMNIFDSSANQQHIYLIVNSLYCYWAGFIFEEFC